MTRSVAERYLVAAFAFMAAATWLGVGLQAGFECLLVFCLAFQAVRLYQRRTGSRGRAAKRRRDRGRLYAPTSAEPHDMSPLAAPGSDRARRSGRVYDGGHEDSGWPVATEATW